MKFERLCVCLCASGVVVHSSLPLPEDVSEALVVDDDCVGSADGECALNALQLRGKQYEPPLAHPVVDLELFQAVNHESVSSELSNVDAYSAVGLLHLLHTRVVWEHEGDWTGSADPRMEKRAHDLDVIVNVNARVRNPNSVIHEVGSVDNFVDFGTLAAFVEGMATGPGYNWDYGDVVGVARLHDNAYSSFHPYYQFSFSGWCPNLEFAHKNDSKSLVEEAVQCMAYSDRYDLPRGEELRGGLCANGTQPGVIPTGKPGCAYTYTPATEENMIKLDDLVGITTQDCGDGRLCEDWQDWRMHCTDKRYKVKFDYRDGHSTHTMSGRRRHSSRRRSLLEMDAESSPGMIQTHVCVEYDIHKACAKNCHSHACQSIPAHLREVGLPFWKGRCDPMRNAHRAEVLAQALGISNATITHSLVSSVKTETCISPEADSMCRPDPSTGGMYCSRAWAGVCQPCYIPNTEEPYPQNASTPTCPWDILRTSLDYVDPKFHPKCVTNLPRDLCCLYSNTCDDAPIAEAMDIGRNTTEDGFAYASSLQSTEAMKAFLWRAAIERYNFSVFDVEGSSEFAYWEWSLRPIPGATLSRAMAMVEHMKGASERS